MNAPRRVAHALLLAAGAGALLVGGCGKTESSPQGAPGAGPPRGDARPVPVAVAPVGLGAVASYYTATASIEAAGRAEVLARTTGVVREILVEEGDRVPAGAPLVVLEDDEARLRVQQADANALTARSEHERKATMRDAGLLSAEEFEAVENNLRVRESELDLAELELDYTRVTAPFAGRVVGRLVDLGTHVSPGTALFELMDDDPLLARVHVPARRMGFVKPGQEIDIHLDSAGLDVRGVVTLVSPVVDPATGTVKVTAEIRRRPDGVRPGDFAQVRIVTERREGATVVPSRAIVEDQGQKVVYVVADSTAARRPVEAGLVEGDVTEILSGLEPGERICVKGQRDLRDGAPVEILEGPGSP
jgi:membrane fusion protein (multidrug efflux system)